VIGQGLIEQKLSSLLGAKVTFEKFSLSLLSGTIEAAGVRVLVPNQTDPLLTVVLLRAQVSIKQAFKGEIIVKSITVEKPVVRLESGRLPHRPTRQPPDESEDKSTSWKFDVQKLFIIDGQLDLHLGSFQLQSGRVLVDLNRAGADYSLTFLAEDVRRSDRQAMIGTVGATGKITGAADLTAIPDAGLNLELTIGDAARMTFSTRRIGELLALFKA
jgi:hypothetical protein